MAEKPASGAHLAPLFTSHSGSQQEQASPAPLTANRFLTEMYHRHVDAVYRYHLARTGDVPLAQDLTSETFHAALAGIDHFDPGRGTPSAWIMGIARRKLADHFRHFKPTAQLELDEDLPDRAEPLETQAGRRLDMRRVAQAMQALSPDRAEALSLHFIAGLSLEETARVMKKRQVAVKKLVQRGLGDLRRSLGKVEEIE